MEIERINENTVKFYISYGDIEERGFDREEIWYNRERSEELFWEMMDEVHQEEEFMVEGPLWIQVQALEKGLEVLVTKAQLSKDGQKFELPLPESKLKDLPVDERIEDLLDQHFHGKSSSTYDEVEEVLEFVVEFDDFENVIQLSKHPAVTHLPSNLYAFEGRYFLYVEFPEDEYEEDEIDNFLSILLEFGIETNVTIHRIEEYGKLILSDNALEALTEYF
ncbi:adapter protein MecA 1/2 [Bacillus oleivorans]|uniref:Adapter protein MecA n=1 Tax=Bacillus oleivorans TaxID=1448271 RepID=A0A285D311_9BACI|nr:adaptor protein MecA [Bacillus oleivorans]SNX74172.1 adapter protein MecA 1/2 [Bacillus oleivorans]